MKYKNFNQDCLTLMPLLESESIDIICIDPPYKYLKNQKLETDFNELEFFTEAKRLLTKDGFIIMFGRGVSFYRMNCILADLGFNFKEEIIWNKMQISSPMNALMRCHETISIFSKGKGKINKIKRPITEAYEFEPKKIIEAIYRISTTFNNEKTFALVKDYFDSGTSLFNEGKERKFNTTVSSDFPKRNRTVQFAVGFVEGITERSIFKNTGDRYTAIHPTQKPVRLLERLINLCLPNKPKNEIVVADFFGGSFSTAEACHNLGVNCVICELDKEYFDKGSQRINKFIKDNFNENPDF